MRLLKKLYTLLDYFSQGPFVYVVMGDSSAEGVGASDHGKSFGALIAEEIKKQKKNTIYHNFGKAGVTIQDVVNSQLKKTVKMNPHLVIISVGFNDIKKGRRVSAFKKEFELLLKTLKKTDARIYICGIPDTHLARRIPKVVKPYVAVRTRQFNRVIEQLSKTHGATYIDLYSAIKALRANKDIISSDGLHPSDIGYAAWATEVISHLHLK